MGGKERGLLYPIRMDGTESLPFMIKKNRVIFGKADHCDIRIYVDGVAPKHCLISFNNEGKGYIVPLHKRALTYINGTLLRKKEHLTHNDVITIVKRSFRFHNSTEVNAVQTPSTSQLDKDISEIVRVHSDGPVKKMRKFKRRVTFGPRLSPEEFDKNLPPAKPVRRGSLPNKDKLLKSPMIKYKTRRNSSLSTSEMGGILTPTKRRSKSPSTNQPKKKLRLSSPKQDEHIVVDSENLESDTVSSTEIVPQSKFSSAKNISNCLPPFPVSNDASVLNVYVETVQKLALSVSMMSAFNMYNKILNDVSSITPSIPSTSKDTRNSNQLSMSNFQNFVQNVFSAPFNNNDQKNILPLCDAANFQASRSNDLWINENNSIPSTSKLGKTSPRKSIKSLSKCPSVEDVFEVNQQDTSKDSSDKFSVEIISDNVSDDDIQEDSNYVFKNDSRKSFEGVSAKQRHMQMPRKSLPAKYVKRKTIAHKRSSVSGKVISFHSNYKFSRSKRVSNVNKDQKRPSFVLKKTMNLESKDSIICLEDGKDDSNFIDIDEEDTDKNESPIKRKSSMSFKRTTRATGRKKTARKSLKSSDSIAREKRKCVTMQKKDKNVPKSIKVVKLKEQKPKEIKAKRGRQAKITVEHVLENESDAMLKDEEVVIINNADKPVKAKRGRKAAKITNENEFNENISSPSIFSEDKKVKRGRKPKNKVLSSPVVVSVAKVNIDSDAAPEKIKRGRKPKKVFSPVMVEVIKKGRKPRKIQSDSTDKVLSSPKVEKKSVKRGRKPRKDISDPVAEIVISLESKTHVKRGRKPQKDIVLDSKPKTDNLISPEFKTSVKRSRKPKSDVILESTPKIDLNSLESADESTKSSFNQQKTAISDTPTKVTDLCNQKGIETPRRRGRKPAIKLADTLTDCILKDKTQMLFDSNSSEVKVKKSRKLKIDTSNNVITKEKKVRKNKSKESDSTAESFSNQPNLVAENKVKRGRPKRNINSEPEKVLKQGRKRREVILSELMDKSATSSPHALQSPNPEVKQSPEKKIVVRRKRNI